MKSKYLYLLLQILFLISCNSSVENKTNSKTDHSLELILDGVFVEPVDDSNPNPERYNLNNKIYKPGLVHTFEFKYLSKEKESFKFTNIIDTSIQFQNKWIFVKGSEVDKKTINGFKLVISKGSDENYNQTRILFKPINLEGREIGMLSGSGLIENEKNIWLHPPRNDLFRILELNPFPFIQQPYEIGNTFKWKLEI